jgi:hypothetical protein
VLSNINSKSPLSLLRLLNKRADVVGLKRSISESFVFCAIWTLAVVLKAMQVGIFSKIPILNISSNSSSSEIRKAWGQGDAGSLLEIAITWSRLDSLDEVTQYWIPRLWSPGMAIIEVPLIWLETAGVPLFWSLLSFTLMIWGSVTFLVWRYFSTLLGRIPTALVLIALIYTWDFDYLLRDYLFYTEGVGYGLLLVGLILLTIRIMSPNNLTRKSVVAAGLIVGLSIWVRHTSDSGLIFLVLIVLLLNFSHSVKSIATLEVFRQRTREEKLKFFKESRRSKPKSIWLKDLTVFSVIAFLVTVPWRLISTFHFDGLAFAMSSASVGVPFTIWSTPDSPSGMYWGGYGSNWACKIDQVTCAIVELDNQNGITSGSHLLYLAALSALRNPLKYLDERLGFLFNHWIPNFSLDFSYQNLAALLFFFILGFCTLLFFKLNDQRKYPILIIWGSFLLMTFAQLSIIHYESRYFIPVRLLSLGAFIGFYLIRSEGKIIENSTLDSRGVPKNGSVR